MPQTKRQLQKEITRQRIMDTAFRLYEEKGFSVSTNSIAQEAGISHGAIFLHFPAKEILQTQVLEQFAKEVGEKLHHLSSANKSIAQLLQGHIQVLKDYEAFYKKLISEISSLPKETRKLLLSMQSVMSWHFRIGIEQAQNAGTIKNLPLHLLFNTWMALLHYYLQNADLFAPGSSVLEQCGDELVNSFMLLISKEY